MVTPIFRSFHRTASSHLRRLELLEHFNVPFFYIYHSEHYGLIFLEDTILFLQGLLFLHFCVHFHIFSPQSTLCMCVMYLTSFDGFF